MKKIFIAGLIVFASTGIAFAQNVDFGASGNYSGSVSPSQNWSPVTAAQSSSGGVRDLNSLVDFIIKYINDGIMIIMAVATLVFVYNIVQYFVVKTDADRTEASKYLLYSIVGLAVIVSFWGLVNVVLRTFDLQNTTQPNIQNIYFKK